MAESFFGFPTDLPNAKEKFAGFGPSGEDLVDFEGNNAIDLLNDETFGANSLDTSWEEKHTDLSEFIQPQIQKESKKYNKSTDVVSFDEAFFPKDTEEEEEEKIIEKTILQLGLDDDQDDIDYSIRPRESRGDNIGDTWSSPQRKEDAQIPSLLEMLSPGKGIWTSPPQAKKDDVEGRSPLKPGAGEGDVIQKLFNAKSSSKPHISLDSVPPPPLPQNAPAVKAMTLEELEKSLVKERKPKEVEMPKATIIERRAPETPGPPPGFMLPFGTPPSGVPLRTPFGMRADRDRSMLAQMSPFMASRFPMAPTPLPGISPILPHGFPLPPRFGPVASPGRHRMNSTPFVRGPWQHPSSRVPYRPRWHWNEKHYHQRDSSQHQYSREDESLNLPPSVLMTSRDKEWLVKIQIMQLMSNDPYLTDYYFVRYTERKMAGDKSGDVDDLEKTMKIVEKHRDNKDYKPATFEGSLGKLSCSSVHHPRQLMDVSLLASEHDVKSRQPNNEASKRRFLIYGLIEKSMEILLTLDDIERRRKDAGDDGRKIFAEERKRRIESVFRLMRLRLHTEQNMSDEDFEVLLLMLNISKGKKLIATLLPTLSQLQAESAILYLWKGIPVLARKDTNQELSTLVMKPVLRAIENASLEFLKQGKELMRSRISQAVLSNKFGISICTACSQRLWILSQEDKGLNPLRLDFAFQINTVIKALPEKAKKRNEADLRMLEAALNLTPS